MAEFDTGDFLKFLFTIIFLLCCCLSLLLYVSKSIGTVLTFIMRYFILPKGSRFWVRSFHIAPLQARIFFQNVFFQNENMSVRIVDGYLTFQFWSFWFKNPHWTRVHEYMISENLVGTRCRVSVNLKSVKGTIISVDVAKKKLNVQLDARAPSVEPEDDEEVEEEEELDEELNSNMNLSDDEPMGRPFETNMRQEINQAFSPGGASTGKRPGSRPFAVPIGRASLPSAAPDMNFPGDEVIKTFDANLVKIKSKPGRLQLHVNGMRLCVYNATGKYNDLATGGVPARKPTNEIDVENHGFKQKIVSMFKKREDKDMEKDENGVELSGAAARRAAAKKIQQHRMKNKSFFQKLFNFIGCVEIELFTCTLDVGGAGASHPYFLHTTFQRGEGQFYLTKPGCPTIDLFRSVAELTLENVDMRMAQMDSKLTESQFMRNTSLRDRAQLLFRGKESTLSDAFDNPQSSELIREFGIIVNGKDKSNLHIVFYKDTPNIYAGEEVQRGELPTTGVELLIDSPEIHYGPWLEYCRFQLWQFFLPPNYRPIQPLEFELGMPRPNASFEFFVEFTRKTKLVVPFKRRATVPSPPFGIKDSNQRGYIIAELGAGTQYIQPGFYLMPGETKQNFQSLFVSNDITVWTNAVLGREAVFARVNSLQFFLDRQDDIIWNGRKLWNILPKISGTELHFYFCCVDFFLDLLNDWQFAQQMYHNVPLTTEIFNSFDRVVKFFIPNVKRFEIIADNFVTLHLNVNTKNVIFSEDPNDLSQNIFARLKVRSAIFTMVLPSDQYQLSCMNEVSRPLNVTVHDIKAYLDLPPTHPLFSKSSNEIPWATSDRCEVRGLFTINVGNQSIPQDRYNMNPTTGRTRMHNFFNLELDFHNTKGTLMGHHIKALIQSFHSIFLDTMFPIVPEELFWLLARLQSDCVTGKNKRKEFKNFLELSQPSGNDMEIYVNVRLIEVEADATVGQGKLSPKINVNTGMLAFSYVKQFAINDTSITLSPVTIRFYNNAGEIIRDDSSFITVGDITVSIAKHFGRMPLKPKIHESMEVKVGGVSFSASVEQLIQLSDIAQTLLQQLKMEDALMEEKVEKARSEAELAAERNMKASTRRRTKEEMSQSTHPPVTAQSLAERNGTTGEATTTTVGATTSITVGDHTLRHRVGNGSGNNNNNNNNTNNNNYNSSSKNEPIREDSDGVAPPLLQSFEFNNVKPKKKKKVFFETSQRPMNSEEIEYMQKGPYTIFTDQISLESAKEFAQFMEDCKRADDNSKDYGLFFDFVVLDALNGKVQVGEEGYVSVDLPYGLSLARSSLNDGNSNKRLSVALKDVCVNAVIPDIACATPASTPMAKAGGGGGGKAAAAAQQPAHTSFSSGQQQQQQHRTYTEIFNFQTSCCLRLYTAFPFDGSLENHLMKQHQFIEENDYEGLISFPFPDQTPPQSPTQLQKSFSLFSDRNGGLADTLPKDAPPTQPRLSKKTSLLQQVVASAKRDEDSLREPPPTVRNESATTSTKSKQVSKAPSVHSSASSSFSGRAESARTQVHEARQNRRAARGTSGHREGEDDDDDSSLLSSLEGIKTCEDQFETCLSASDSDIFSGENSFYDPNGAGGSHGMENSSSQAFARDYTAFSGGPAGADTPTQKAAPKPRFCLREEIPMHRFYRVFFTVDSRLQGVSTLDHVSCHSNRHLNAYAPLPSVAFILKETQEEFPEYVVAREFYETNGVNADSFFAGKISAADNRERSRTGSTTKHLHIEVLDPITMLVTKRVAPMLGRMLSTWDMVKEKIENKTGSLSFQKSHGTSFAENTPLPLTGNTAALFRENKKGKKSRAREQQKRWQWEDIIISAFVPCVEVKIMTNMLVPKEYLPLGEKGIEGMYCSTLAIQTLRFVTGYNRPPGGVEASNAVTKLLTSLNVSNISVVSQIEYEPIMREGNLEVKHPQLFYDHSKDTICIFYISSIVGRGKRDIVRGTDGGACSITIDTISVNITRDFVCYALSLSGLVRSIIVDVRDHVQLLNQRRNSSSGKDTGLLSKQTTRSTSASYRGTSTSSFGVSADKSRTVQGKGSIQAVQITIVDSFKSGQYIKVDKSSASKFELRKPMTNFVLKSHRRKHEKVQTLQLQFVGDVEAFRVKVFPSIIKCLHLPQNEEPSPVSRDRDGTHTPSSDSFSITSPQKYGGGGGRGTDANHTSKRKFNLLYNGTFSFHTLDVRLMQSESNYAQLLGKNLTGCAEARSEKLSSRECVQVEALTEAISERLKQKLRQKANRARERAKQSRSTAPPVVTPQLQLKSTASFFSEQLLLHYVADNVLSTAKRRGSSSSSGATTLSSALPAEKANPSAKTSSPVLAAVVGHVAVTAQFTEQYNMKGKQVNVQMIIERVKCVAPYRPNSAETVNPQIQQLLYSWRQAAKSVQKKKDVLNVIASSPPRRNEVVVAAAAAAVQKVSEVHNSAFVITLQAKNIEGVVELPQNISQRFVLPKLFVHIQRSSNGRLSVKLHAHPFSITSKTSAVERYQVTLPNIYTTYALDPIKVLSTFMMETVAITVTPLFINHTLLTAERIKELLSAVSKKVPVGDQVSMASLATSHSDTYESPKTPAPPKSPRRFSFLFLLKGLQFSYLTTMTNLRFSIRRLNATAESTSQAKNVLLHWVINVTRAQVAIVDRDDHDQLMTKLRAARAEKNRTGATNEAATGVPPTAASTLKGNATPTPRTKGPSLSDSKTPHPLGGYIWGSAELSLTLSSGKTSSSNEIQDALQSDASFQICSPEIQKALLDNVGHSSSRWNLSVFSPLIILRFGLEFVLKELFDETQNDIGQLKSAAAEENQRFRLMLSTHKRFKKLQEQKRRYEALIKRSEVDKAAQVRFVTEKVIQNVSFQRRNAIGAEEEDLLKILKITSEHKFVASISNFLVVIPFGDAVFKNLMDDEPEMFSCGKAEFHVHNVTCLKRRQFIPALALKCRIDDTSLICGVESVKQFTPFLFQDPLPRTPNGRTDDASGNNNNNNNSTDKGYKSSLKFRGRFLTNRVHLYVSEGSTIDSSSLLSQLLTNTVIMGGLGYLNSYTDSEIRHSRNTIFIELIESSFRMQKVGDESSVVVVLDLSGPSIHLSSQFINILSQIMREASPTSTKLLATDANANNTSNNPTPTADTNDLQQAFSFSTPNAANNNNGDTQNQNGNTVFRLDLSARLGSGRVRIYALKQPDDLAQNTTATMDSKLDRKYAPISRRREEKTARVLTPEEEFAYRRSRRQTKMVSAKDMECLVVIPFPGVVLQVARQANSNFDVMDHTMVRGEIRTGTIEIGPSITTLAKEIRDYGTQFQSDYVARRKRVFALIQEVEPQLKDLNIPLHCSLKDLLIPLPRAFTTALGGLRVDHLLRVRGHRTSSLVKHKHSLAHIGVPERKRNSFSCIHICLTHFSVVLTTEPLASTVFTLMLDDHGSVDLIFKKFQFPHKKLLVNNDPNHSMVLNVVKLRAECQTKLEVKSLEVYLPEAELAASQRSGEIGLVNSMALNLPFNVEGSEPNVILRVQHLSQLFTMFELWTYSLKETINSVKDSIQLHMGKNKIPAQPPVPVWMLEDSLSETAREVMQCDVVNFIVVNVSCGYCYIDLGSGNSHQLIFGTGRLALEKNASMDGSVTQLIRGHVSNVSVQCEGVLSGSAKLSDVMLQAFTIKNIEDYDDFRRSKEGRTFRARLLVKKVHVTLKERQLKDIFECKIAGLDADAMDGIGEEHYTTTDLNVLLVRSTLGVTPSTVPAVLTFVKGISFTVAEQKRIALDKIQENKLVSAQQSKVASELRDLVTRRNSSTAHSPSTLLTPKPGFAEQRSNSSSPSSPANRGVVGEALLPFFGNKLTHAPCGQLRFTVEDTTLLLGAISSGEAATGCVVASFPKARLSFAECPCEDYTAVKKITIIETHNVELFRPGTYKVVIMGFRGDNYFELYTRQVIGSQEIGFTLTLKQSHPWTGNPRFKDFEEMISLVKSFTDRSNADVFQKFGRVDANFTMPPPAAVVAAEPTTPAKGDGLPHEIELDSSDTRILKALKSINFSPQLRFGGDVSVNTEVILNWVGITEKMLPNILNSKLCDKMENALSHMAAVASERIIKKKEL